MRESAKFRVDQVHPHAGLWEPLENEPTFTLQTMFGTKSVYLDGKILFCFATKTEPWSGVLVATDRSRHAALIAEFPTLVPHPVLPKWLYLSDAIDSFETSARHLVRLARRRDPRLGVAPQPKKLKPAKLAHRR